MRTVKRIFALALLLAAPLGLAAYGAAPTQAPVSANFRCATSQATGAFVIIGNAQSQVMNKYYPSIKMNIEVTSGSVANMQMLATDDTDLAYVSSNIIVDAMNGGTKSFPEKIESMAVFAYNEGTYHLMAHPNSGITTLDDILGKRVGTAEPNSGSEMMTIMFFNAMGWDINKDIRRQRASLPDMMEAMQDHRMDFSFNTTPLPNATIMEALTTQRSAVLIPFDEDKRQALHAMYPLVYPSVIPAGTYQNAEDIPTVGWTNLVICRPDEDEEAIYRLTKTLFDHLDEWKDGHSSTSTWTLEKAIMGSPVEFHPGAVRYFKEVGIMQ